MPRVLNRLSVGSFEVVSLAGSTAPPPGYTSQRDTASIVAVINDDEESVILKDLSPPPSKDSAPLRSPYSNEDLRSHEQVQDQNPTLTSCTHGYSQCAPVRSNSYYPPQQQQQRDARPLSSETLHFYNPLQVLSADNLFGATNEQSRPYYPSSTEEHWQPPIQPDTQHQHQQLTSPHPGYTLPTSPYHHHRQSTYPPALRVLAYSSTDDGHYGRKEYGNEEGEGNHQSSALNDKSMMMAMMMNSTATILSPSEEPLGSQSTPDLPRRRRRRLPSLPNRPARQATIAINRTKTVTKKKNSPTAKSLAKAHPTPTPVAPTQTHPTNYVYISRKCIPPMPTSKSRGWRRRKTIVQSNNQIPPPPKLSSTSSSSAITGTFTINPELYIPPSLLNAMEDPVFSRFKPSSSDTGEEETRKRKGSSRTRTNLRLEVENGGIDVDIHLVPTTTISNNVEGGEDAGNRGQQQQDTTSSCDTPVQAQASASTSTTAFTGSGPPSSSSTHPRQQSSTTSMQENPSGGISSSSRNANSIPGVTQQTSSSSGRRDKKKPQSRPTTIDLQIKQVDYQQGSLNIQNQDSVKINGPIVLPLIARIVSFFTIRLPGGGKKIRFALLIFFLSVFSPLFRKKTNFTFYNSTHRIQDVLSISSLLQLISPVLPPPPLPLPPALIKLQILLPLLLLLLQTNSNNMISLQ